MREDTLDSTYKLQLNGYSYFKMERVQSTPVDSRNSHNFLLPQALRMENLYVTMLFVLEIILIDYQVISSLFFKMTVIIVLLNEN
mgnify:FL=1